MRYGHDGGAAASGLALGSDRVGAGFVAVGGGLTLWVQDSTESQGPYVWEQTKPRATADLPPCPAPDEGGAALCVYTDAD